jgi:DNA helicase-4
MKYIDNNYYLQNKKFLGLLLKYKIYKNNKLYLKEKTFQDYKINDIFLDKEQKEALFTEEINTLILASAGSGKTLTICAKVDLLIDDGIKPEEILVLSFTNNSVNDLKSKIKYDISIYTFHKLAIEILSDYNTYYSLSGDYLEYIIKEIFLSISKNISDEDLSYFVNEISSFIKLFKSYGLDKSYLNKISKNNLLLKVIDKIYDVYDNELNSQGLYDFNDIIKNACELIRTRGFKRYYKYIIIDEFQDISFERAELIKLIKESCDSKLFAVGDDFQSIYKFSGSSVDMIINFKKYFGYTKVIKLSNTYRNSMELIRVSTKFISKNPYQIKKKIKSVKSIERPVKIIYYKKNMSIKFKKILDMVSGEILILSRNNKDIDYVLDDEIVLKDNIYYYKERELEFKTVHKAKGLESDNVILLNLNNSPYGFPNRIDNKLQRKILPKNKYLYEEERRLFYVALTRTKNNIYLLVDKDNPSIFVKELLYNSRKYIEIINM